MNSLYSALPTTIFEVMSSLSRHHDAVNLGQGFPDDPGPVDVRQIAAQQVLHGYNQYPSMLGIPELRQAISVHYKKIYECDYEPNTEVLVTSGATEALASALFALIEPGDEVIIFQPAYDAYAPLVRRAGGRVKFVSLRPPHWEFSDADLAQAFSNKTRLVIFNNPMNPCGIVYSQAQVQLLAKYCINYGVIAVCDEVWEHVIFDHLQHHPMHTIEGMRDLTVKIGSGGKIFSLTGWKVGWILASEPLMDSIKKAHQFFTFTTPPNLQSAIAYGLGKDMSYFTHMRQSFQTSRDRLASGLQKLNLSVLPSQGTYFLTVDLATRTKMDDETFCKMLVSQAKVAAIPVSAFYEVNPVRSVVRFCFAKNDATLDTALERLYNIEHILNEAGQS